MMVACVRYKYRFHRTKNVYRPSLPSMVEYSLINVHRGSRKNKFVNYASSLLSSDGHVPRDYNKVIDKTE